jgi:hypothetical protein
MLYRALLYPRGWLDRPFAKKLHALQPRSTARSGSKIDEAQVLYSGPEPIPLGLRTETLWGWGASAAKRSTHVS